MHGPTKVKFVPVIVHSLSVSLHALLLPDLCGGSRRISYSFQWTELVPTLGQHHSRPKHPSTTFIVFANLSQISLLPNPARPLIVHPRKIFPHAVISPADFPVTATVTPRHTPVTPDSSGAWTHARLPQPPRCGCRGHITQGFDVRHELGPPLRVRRRASRQTPACSVYRPLVRTGKAEMKYIVDYPADAGSLTRLDGSSGQGGTDISRDKRP